MNSDRTMLNDDAVTSHRNAIGQSVIGRRLAGESFPHAPRLLWRSVVAQLGNVDMLVSTIERRPENNPSASPRLEAR